MVLICYKCKDKRNKIECTKIMLYFSSKIELDMDQEQEIKNLKRKLLELSYNYYKFRVSLYYKVIFILLFLLLGLIVGFLL
nr:MAG TPA: hypothetical protein [Caudoviricetes sp.]